MECVVAIMAGSGITAKQFLAPWIALDMVNVCKMVIWEDTATAPHPGTASPVHSLFVRKIALGMEFVTG